MSIILPGSRGILLTLYLGERRRLQLQRVQGALRIPSGMLRLRKMNQASGLHLMMKGPVYLL